MFWESEYFRNNLIILKNQSIQKNQKNQSSQYI